MLICFLVEARKWETRRINWQDAQELEEACEIFKKLAKIAGSVFTGKNSVKGMQEM